ncbi:Rpp14/Pop5 family protein [Ignisphaera sp. 4213-co]|uniref:Rpp14/Pop5 family protein n=1 Tax=Ignisphaera cupida TaxID=3050454 RepID=A0ABD4Z7T7_9CREN|nr:Rpp14/Pop5 family protein [Ignisphaera sp. 4213-co]MDK6029270.1 Rpp14/Pop5 family protein [Ignisphaera sp. 4213-co]
MDFISIVAIAIALASLVIVFAYTHRMWKYISMLLDELSIAMLVRKKSRKVKRYILVKFICKDKTDLKSFVKSLENMFTKLLGELDKIDCGITVASISTDSSRAIIRVVGDYRCLKRVLITLSIQHILFEGCIVVPIKTSGLMSRLRKML